MIEEHETVTGRRWRTLGAGFLAGAVSVMFLMVFGTYFPQGPLLALGQVFTEFFGPWILLSSVVAAGISILRWRQCGRKIYVVTAACAMFAAIGCVNIIAAQLSTIWASGADVKLTSSFGLGAASRRNPPPVVATYAAFDGVNFPVAIFRPAEPPHGAAPVLIYVHGGGWISGDYRQRDPDLRWFADLGVVVVSVEYALSGPNRHLWAKTQSQIGCALTWVQANIGRYGGDPTHVAMIGESAGGNLVINVAYLANRQALKSACSGKLPHISAVVSLYPVIDVASFYQNNGVGFPATARDMAMDYTGGTPSQYPARYAAVSSANAISIAAPATIIIVGANDTLVPPGPAYKFARDARKAGVNVSLISIPYAGHAFDFWGGSINNQLTRIKTMQLIAKEGLFPKS